MSAELVKGILGTLWLPGAFLIWAAAMFFREELKSKKKKAPRCANTRRAKS